VPSSTGEENTAIARGELDRKNGPGRVATAFGLVFNVDDFIDAMDNISLIKLFTSADEHGYTKNCQRVIPHEI